MEGGGERDNGDSKGDAFKKPRAGPRIPRLGGAPNRSMASIKLILSPARREIEIRSETAESFDQHHRGG